MPYYFKFYDNERDPRPSFTCALDSERCDGQNKNGQRCSRKCIIGTPYCVMRVNQLVNHDQDLHDFIDYMEELKKETGLSYDEIVANYVTKRWRTDYWYSGAGRRRFRSPETIFWLNQTFCIIFLQTYGSFVKRKNRLHRHKWTLSVTSHSLVRLTCDHLPCVWLYSIPFFSSQLIYFIHF